jgi:hypothetical protein
MPIVSVQVFQEFPICKKKMRWSTIIHAWNPNESWSAGPHHETIKTDYPYETSNFPESQATVVRCSSSHHFENFLQFSGGLYLETMLQKAYVHIIFSVV